MKKRELKKLAQKMAQLELIASGEKEGNSQKAQQEIIELTGKIDDPEDLFYLDELIQEILEEKKS